MRTLPTLIALLALSSLSLAQDPVRPPELGTLHYSPDLDATLARARGPKSDGKPIFVVFQEIPG